MIKQFVNAWIKDRPSILVALAEAADRTATAGQGQNLTKIIQCEPVTDSEHGHLERTVCIIMIEKGKLLVSAA